MDINQLKKEIANLPKNFNKFIGKQGVGKTALIRELAKKHNIPLADEADFGKIEPVEIDENAKKVDFDTTAFFSNKNLITFWDEMMINGITGETFTNGENN